MNEWCVARTTNYRDPDHYKTHFLVYCLDEQRKLNDGSSALLGHIIQIHGFLSNAMFALNNYQIYSINVSKINVLLVHF